MRRLNVVLPASNASPANSNGERVLVIDDDLAALESTVALLASWGLTPISAESGEQALSLLQNETAPSLIVCDYRLPQTNGIDLLRMLHAHGDEGARDTPSVAIPALKRSLAMQASGFPVMYKPVRPAKLRL